MSRLRRLPDWVGHPLPAVADAESILLSVFDETRAPQALGSWVSLAWLGAGKGPDTTGPFRREAPTEMAAWAAMSVAGSVADAELYPAPSWWATRGIARADRMSRQEWVERTGSTWERHYARGVAVALGWVTGELTDPPRAMCPSLNGGADPISSLDRERYRTQLHRVAAGTAVR